MILYLLSVLVVLIGYFYSSLLYSGPFDPLPCQLTYRTIGCKDIELGGTVAKGYESVRDSFYEQFRNGYSKGAQLQIWRDGKPVVELWGRNGDKGYNDQSLQIIFSCTKTISPLVLAWLEERGLIDWYKPISHYWPEFGKNGKEHVTIAELMRHESGLDGCDVTIPFETFLNQDNPKFLAETIENSHPSWSKRSKRCYHGVSRGLIENEIVKRVDPKKRDLGQIFLEEISSPLGLDFWIGHIPENEYKSRFFKNEEWPQYYQAVHVTFPYLTGTLNDDDLVQMINAFSNPDPAVRAHHFFDEFDVDRLCTFPALEVVSPSTNGVANAKSLAKLLALVANKGELNGIRLFKEITIDKMMAITTAPTIDVFFNRTTLFSDGGWGKDVFDEFPGFYGWSGWGGSIAQFNPDTKVVFTYLMTGMGVHIIDDRSRGPAHALQKIK